VDPYKKVNSDFERQSRIGHATGYTKPSPEMRKFLDKFYAREEDSPETVYLYGEQGLVTNQLTDDEALG